MGNGAWGDAGSEHCDPASPHAPFPMRFTPCAPTGQFHIQNVHRPVKITYSDSARFVTPWVRIRSPRLLVLTIHQL